MYRPQFLRHRFEAYAARAAVGSCLSLTAAGVEAVPLDQPGRVVGLPEGEQRLTQFLDGVEGPHPQEVLLEGPDEPLGTAVALGRAHEGGRTLDAEEAELLLEVVRHVLASVVVADRKTAGDLLGEAAEVLPHALAERLESLEAGARRVAWMPTHSAEQ